MLASRPGADVFGVRAKPPCVSEVRRLGRYELLPIDKLPFTVVCVRAVISYFQYFLFPFETLRNGSHGPTTMKIAAECVMHSESHFSADLVVY